MAQTEKRENSVLFSLRELRQIEENRVSEEEQAVRSAEQARIAAAQAEERRIRDEADAKARAERDEQLRIEQAREGAEREARMRVEAGEAAERQRSQAALEQQRLNQEMDLRRAHVAKTRPTWMLAVTGIAVIGAIGLIFFAVNAMNDRRNADDQKVQAERDRDEAIRAAKDAQVKRQRLRRAR